MAYCLTIRSILQPFVTYILWPFGILYDYLEYFFHVLVSCAKKNLATLAEIFVTINLGERNKKMDYKQGDLGPML
jgi:hypothetical protein